MENKKDYAVLFKKDIVNGVYGVIMYTPCYVVDGFYDEENQVFLDEMNIERPLMQAVQVLAPATEYCVGLVYSEDELLEKYSNARNIGEAKIYFNDDSIENIYLGFYDEENKAITTILLNIENMYKILNKDNQVVNCIGDNNNNSNISVEAQYYENLKRVFNNNDLTVLLYDDITELLRMDNLDKIKDKLKSLKQNKNQYYHIMKIKENADSAEIMPDKLIDKILNMTDIGEVKRVLSQYSDYFSITNINGMRNIYVITYEEIQRTKSLDDIKKFLLLMKDTYTESLEEYDDIRDNTDNVEELECYRAVKAFVEMQIKAINILVKLENVDEIKAKYKELYDSSIVIIDEIEKDMEHSMVTIKDEARQIEEEEYNKVFKKKTDEDIKSVIKPQIDKLNQLVGLDNIKEMVERITARMVFANKTEDLLNIEKPSMNMVFTGNPGTGKTTVAGIIAPVFHKLGYLTSDKVCVAAAEDLIAGYVGQTAIKTKKLIDENKGGLIVIDEAYILASEAQEFGTEALTVILKEMETNRTAFVFAGYEKEMTDFINMNSGLKSRIKPRNFLKFKDYQTEELVEIFKRLVENASISKDESKKLKLGEGVIEEVGKRIESAKKRENFGNARYVNSLFQEVLDEHSMNVVDATSIDDLLTISIKDIPVEEKINEKEKVKTIGFRV